jgi:hypothetical protein
MKLPQLRVLAVTAAALAMVTGGSAVAANAAATSGVQANHVTAPTTARPIGRITAPVTGTFTNKAGQGHFNGTFVPKKFTVNHGVLDATGVLKGRLTSAKGTTLGRVDRTVTFPVNTGRTDALHVCNILNLVLGPLHLNLLGLQVHLNRVHLTIRALPGAGHLLGNLLCRIAHLLDSHGSLGKISTLLNRVLSML